MAFKQDKNKILESANTYLILGNLLKKKRSRRASNEIEKIFLLKVSDEDKIKKIKEIDHAATKQKQILKKEKPKLKKPVKPLPKKPSPPEKLHKANIILYFLIHLKKIYSFGKKTQTLKLKIPAFTFEIHQDVGVSLYEVQNIIQELIDPLNYIIEKGWTVLAKEEYNLIVSFYEFCDHYYKEFLKDFDYTDLILLQKRFFIVTQKERYLNLLIDAVEKGLENHKLYHPKIKSLTEMIKKVIEPNFMTPSLTNIFLAVQMHDLKSYFSIDDLIYTENPPLIKKSEYQVSDDVANKITHFLWEKEQLLLAKEKELLFYRFITENFTTHHKKHSFSLLRKFCFVEDDKKQNSNFREKIEDLAHFIILLLKEFHRVFRQFTLEKIPLTTTDNKLVQEKIVPYALDSKFRAILKDYHMLVDFNRDKSFFKVSFNQYNKYVKNEGTFSENEKALFIILTNLSQNFYEIALRLYQNFTLENQLDNISLKKRMEIVNDNDIFEKIIPYATGRLNLNYYLSNKTVLDAYIELLEFSINFALFCLNKSLIDQFEHQPKLEEDIANLNQLILRMR